MNFHFRFLKKFNSITQHTHIKSMTLNIFCSKFTIFVFPELIIQFQRCKIDWFSSIFHSKNSIISTKNNQAKHHTRISHFEYHHHRILLLFHHHHYHHYQKPNHFQSIITVESNCTMTYIDTQRHVQRINPSITNTNGAWIFFFTIHFPIVLLCNRFFRRFLNYFHTVFLLLLKWKAQIENGNWKWKYEKDIEGVKWI